MLDTLQNQSYWNRLLFSNEGLYTKEKKAKPSKPVDIQRFIEQENNNLRKWYWRKRILVVSIQGTC